MFGWGKKKEDKDKEQLEKQMSAIDLKKRELIKLEQEVEDMVSKQDTGKFELKDGKLVVKQQQLAPDELPPLPPEPNEDDMPFAEDPSDQEDFEDLESEPEPEPMPTARPAPQQLRRDPVRQGAPLQQQQLRARVSPNTSNRPIGRPRSITPAPQPELRQQARIQPQRQPVEQYVEAAEEEFARGQVLVRVVLTNNQIVPLSLPEDELQTWVNALGDSMSKQTPIQLGNRILNGRYIVEFLIGGE